MICGVAPEGYLNDRINKTIYKDPVRFPLLRKAIDLMLTGEYSVQQILEIMNNEWGYRTVKRKKKVAVRSVAQPSTTCFVTFVTLAGYLILMIAIR